jgi:ribosomal protein L29
MKSQDRAVIKALPEPELRVQLKECEEKLFKLRFANAATPLKNGLEIRHLKTHRARLLTWLKGKEIASGGRENRLT